MKFIQDLLEMGEYEEENHKMYDKEEEAKEHAQEFLDKASEVLSHNKKEGGTDEVNKLALQFAKDYHESICDVINGERYNGGSRGEESGDEMGGDEGMGGMSGGDMGRGGSVMGMMS